MSKTHDVVMIPVDKCEPAPWNTNVEDLGTFNELVASIEEDGFLENIVVVERAGRYQIVGGEHRWKAAKLAGLKEIPAVVVDWDEDQAKIRNIRLNVIRGKQDPEKFAELWNELQKKYGRPALLRLLGMQHREREVERLIGRVKRSMPKEMQKELERRQEKIRNVEDLAAVVQTLYSQFGSTLDSSFLFLTFGGQVHVMVKLSKKNHARLERLLVELRSRGEDANVVIGDLLDRMMSGEGGD